MSRSGFGTWFSVKRLPLGLLDLSLVFLGSFVLRKAGEVWTIFGVELFLSPCPSRPLLDHHRIRPRQSSIACRNVSGRSMSSTRASFASDHFGFDPSLLPLLWLRGEPRERLLLSDGTDPSRCPHRVSLALRSIVVSARRCA